MKLHSLPFYGVTYRAIMRLAHRFNWHHAPPCYPDGDTMLRCSWCGFSAVVKHRNCIPLEMLIAREEQDPTRKAALDEARAEMRVWWTRHPKFNTNQEK